MKRSYLGLLFLGALLVLGLLSCRVLVSSAPLAKKMEEAGICAQAEDWETAQALYEEAKESWNRRGKLLAALSDHEPLSRIHEQFAQAGAFIRSRDPREAAASLTQLALQLKSFTAAHRLTWWNIL